MTKTCTATRTLLMLGLFAMWPSAASAQMGWFDWIEGLSGPGPFRGYSVGYRVLCTKEVQGRKPGEGRYSVDPTCFSDRDPAIRQMLEIRVGRFASDDHPRFADTPSDTREVTFVKLESFMKVRVNATLDAGAGVGRVRFRGDGFDPFWRTTVTPVSLTFAPLALGQPDDVRAEWWRRLLKLHYEMTYFHTGFTGADFGNSATSYATARDWVRTIGLEVDFGALLNR